MKKPISVLRCSLRVIRRRLTYLGATVAILTTAVHAEAQDSSAFHELETKCIFGFTIGSSTGIEGQADRRFAGFRSGGFSRQRARLLLEFEF